MSNLADVVLKKEKENPLRKGYLNPGELLFVLHSRPLGELYSSSCGGVLNKLTHVYSHTPKEVRSMKLTLYRLRVGGEFALS